MNSLLMQDSKDQLPGGVNVAGAQWNPTYYVANASGRSCRITHCPSPYYILDATGECQECAAGQFPNADRSACDTVTCSDFEIVGEKGECEACPGSNYPAATGRSCIFKLCAGYQTL